MSFKFETEANLNSSSVLPQSSSISGLQDIVNNGPIKKVNDEFTKGHPLESRLANWENSQLGMKLHMQRQIYGLHAPLRTMMEIQSVQKAPSLLGSRASRIQLDILMGKDDTIGVEDVFSDDALEADIPDVHRMLAQKLNL
ncbi:hypothetical protein GGI25_003811 [Coemansia spiralis]|uniref:Proteasome maturation factor UMP1 n=2 Tax=Coemansia TaxID=4863 RepID=A0A9W8KY20_9FUNG|nr:proteasome maturation factor UMP1 [Coemansia spiralis]KAJ1994639.1 hypothetical protein EDC05_001556 [Coemansia umbellata]KAJ2624444.1 hypothetical protein GGI26_001579 [Coemansia sp. RSA 1358]KAJ2675974.1 hypothetical protein GGI25_003811 [Coemansia spiralis]